MMEEQDIKKPDPKRVGLEQDTIILENATNQLKSMLNSYPEPSYDPYLEKDYKKRSILLFKQSQRAYLERIVEYYEEEYNKLVKEDSL